MKINREWEIDAISNQLFVLATEIAINKKLIQKLK